MTRATGSRRRRGRRRAARGRQCGTGRCQSGEPGYAGAGRRRCSTDRPGGACRRRHDSSPHAVRLAARGPLARRLAVARLRAWRPVGLGPQVGRSLVPLRLPHSSTTSLPSDRSSSSRNAQPVAEWRRNDRCDPFPPDQSSGRKPIFMPSWITAVDRPADLGHLEPFQVRDGVAGSGDRQRPQSSSGRGRRRDRASIPRGDGPRDPARGNCRMRAVRGCRRFPSW